MWWVLGLISMLNFPLDPRLPGIPWRQAERQWTQGHQHSAWIWTRYSFQNQPVPGPTPSLSVTPEALGYLTDSSDLWEAHLSLHFRYAWRPLPFVSIQGQQTFLTVGHQPALPHYDVLYWPDFRLYTFDPNPIVGEQNLFEVRTDQALVRLHLPSGFVFLGKDRVRLGPGYRGSILLSGFARPLTYLYNAHWEARRWAFTTFYAWLPDTFPQRRFALQRVEFQPWPWLSLGATEGILFSAPEDPLKYINPVDLYYVIQRRGRTNDDNLVATVDVNWRIRPGLCWYAEFLDDDVIISGESVRNRSLWGYLSGFHLSKGAYDARLEFAWVRKWTYTHYTQRNSVTFWGIPLGHWMGSDARNLYVEVSKTSDQQVIASFVEVLEHGEGRLSVPLEEDPQAASYRKTPSGVVDRRIALGVYALKKNAFHKTSLGLLFRIDQIRNERNVEGRNDLRLTLVFWGSLPTWTLPLPW